jgi:hypothetical protein
MWEPRRLRTLWASTAYYRDRFTFLLYVALCDEEEEVYIDLISVGLKAEKNEGMRMSKGQGTCKKCEEL